jgi:hypothetical protein
MPWLSLGLLAGRPLGYKGGGPTMGNRTVWTGILDGLIFASPGAGPAFLLLGHKDVEGGLWALLWLAPVVRLPLAILRTFWLDHPWRLFFSYDDILALG